MGAISLLIIIAGSVSIGFFLGRTWIKEDLRIAEQKIIHLEQNQAI